MKLFEVKEAEKEYVKNYNKLFGTNRGKFVKEVRNLYDKKITSDGENNYKITKEEIIQIYKNINI